MKVLEWAQTPELLFVEGKQYEKTEDKEVKVGTILYDGRYQDILKIETEKDVLDYGFVTPECYCILKEV